MHSFLHNMKRNIPSHLVLFGLYSVAKVTPLIIQTAPMAINHVSVPEKYSEKNMLRTKLNNTDQHE